MARNNSCSFETLESAARNSARFGKNRCPPSLVVAPQKPRSQREDGPEPPLVPGAGSLRQRFRAFRCPRFSALRLRVSAEPSSSPFPLFTVAMGLNRALHKAKSRCIPRGLSRVTPKTPLRRTNFSRWPNEQGPRPKTLRDGMRKPAKQRPRTSCLHPRVVSCEALAGSLGSMPQILFLPCPPLISPLV